jgi:allantoate deiminase
LLQSDPARIQADIEELARFTATPGRGITRFSFTEEDRLAREFIKTRMKQAGLAVREDAAGSVIGRREGRRTDAPVVIVGSHFDSVKNGGPFDGPAGIVTALEIARVFEENKISTEFPVEFIAMIEEEGGRFGGGVFGSRAIVGRVSFEDLKSFKDTDGISMAEAMERFGFVPEKIRQAVRTPEQVKAFFELHIEQGPVLEKRGLDVGIVETVVGIEQFEIFVEGRPDHAGTTPMDMRCDALVAAIEIVKSIHDMAAEAGSGTVGTVGRLTVSPGAANIVPGSVSFSVDLRSAKETTLNALADQTRQLVLDLPNRHPGIRSSIVSKLSIAPTHLSSDIAKLMETEGVKRNIRSIRMLSGAGHDAMVMAGITDVGLVFVPSKDGRSHCPEEWTDYEQLKKGIDVVLGAILQVAVAQEI